MATQLTDKTNIQIGFEVECYIDENHSNQWENAVTELHAENCIDYDGSIDPPWCTDIKYSAYEIQTAVLPPSSAIAHLKTLFAMVNKWGGTNESCGLHLNISSTDKKRMKRFNPFPFVASPIWARMVRDFGRQYNDYCVTPNLKRTNTPMALFESLVDGEAGCSFLDKDSCVNFANWNDGRHKTSRVEIRGMGGDNYHKKLPLIMDYTKKVIKLFMICCDIPVLKVKSLA